jgi:beta-N-acetylhexosaminidase
VMSAHLMLPHIDGDFPATLSKIFLKTYLRDELNFEGVVISDDMEMHATAHHFGAAESPIMALQAGCDQLCYRSEEHAKIAIESIKKAVIDKKLDSDSLKRSIDRVRKVRARIKLAQTTMSLQERLQTIRHPDHLEFVNHLTRPNATG